MPFLWCNTQTLHWLNTFKLDPKLEIKVVQMGTLQCSLDIFFPLLVLLLSLLRMLIAFENVSATTPHIFGIKGVSSWFLLDFYHQILIPTSCACVPIHVFFFSSRCILVVETLWIYWTAMFGRPIPIKRIYCSNIAIHGRETESQRKAEDMYLLLYSRKNPCLFRGLSFWLQLFVVIFRCDTV